MIGRQLVGHQMRRGKAHPGCSTTALDGSLRNLGIACCCRHHHHCGTVSVGSSLMMMIVVVVVVVEQLKVVVIVASWNGSFGLQGHGTIHGHWIHSSIHIGIVVLRNNASCFPSIQQFVLIQLMKHGQPNNDFVLDRSLLLECLQCLLVALGSNKDDPFGSFTTSTTRSIARSSNDLSHDNPVSSERYIGE